MSRRPRRNWTNEQKQSIAAEARRRIDAGQSLRHAAKSVDLHENTLREWLERFPAPQLAAVQIIEDAMSPRASASISIATPDGFLIDGLDLASAIRFWERLR